MTAKSQLLAHQPVKLLYGHDGLAGIQVYDLIWSGLDRYLTPPPGHHILRHQLPITFTTTNKLVKLKLLLSLSGKSNHCTK